MRFLVVFALLLASVSAHADTFDLATFTPPSGFKREVASSHVRFTRVASGRYCIFAVYQSRAGAGDASAEVATEWKSLVAGMYEVKGDLVSERADSVDGFSGHVMAAPISANGGNASAILATYAGLSRVVSVLLVFDDATCPDAIAASLSSLHFKKAADATPAAPAGAITTSFDDGWVATRLDDRVAVTKGDVRVSLFYSVAMTERMRDPVISTKDYFWNAYVVPRFDVITATNRNAEYMYTLKPEFVEGQVKEKGTGRPRYAAINVALSSGTARLVLVTTPDKATFDAMFKTPEDLLKLLDYNKFSMPPAELVGSWSNSSSAFAQYYNATTGAYVGMGVAATSATFTFRANGTYQSIHDGATGRVGQINTFHQDFKGEVTTETWKLTATKRFDGKTETFGMWREAIAGGWVLHLDSPGISYALVKVK